MKRKTSGVSPYVPVKKTPPYRTIIRNLIASKKLSAGEQKAFEKLHTDLVGGAELSQHQMLWIEALNEKHLKKVTT